MEYIFGTDCCKEELKTIGSSHSDLTGFHELVREYPDMTITDRFCVESKIRSAEDEDGNCYDWYHISNHYRYTDKTEPVKVKTEENAANIDYIAMMAEIEL